MKVKEIEDTRGVRITCGRENKVVLRKSKEQLLPTWYGLVQSPGSHRFCQSGIIYLQLISVIVILRAYLDCFGAFV